MSDPVTPRPNERLTEWLRGKLRRFMDETPDNPAHGECQCIDCFMDDLTFDTAIVEAEAPRLFADNRRLADELAAARERIRADRDERKYLIELALRATERIHLDKDYWQVCGIQKCVCPEVREALANSRALVTPVPEGEKATAVLDEDGLCAACEGTKRMQRMVGHDAYGYIVVESTDIPCPDCMAAPVAQNTAACEWSQSGAYCLTHQSPARTCVAAPTEEAR